MNILNIDDIIKGVGSIADDLFTSDEERLKIAIQEKSINASLTQGQLAIIRNSTPLISGTESTSIEYILLRSRPDRT